MNLQYVKYALEISRTGSISKAAENLSVAQPNLSRAVKELESQLGISIFERTRTGMTVTPEGEKLLSAGERILREVGELETMFDGEAIPRESLSVMAAPSAYAAHAFVSFCASLPEDRIYETRYSEGDLNQTLDAVVSGTAKLGIIRIPLHFEKYYTDKLTAKDLKYETVTEFSPVILAGLGSSLAGKDSVTPVSLGEFCQVVSPESLPIEGHTDSHAVKKEITVTDRATAYALLANDPSLCIVAPPMPSFLAAQMGLVQRPCFDTTLYRDLLICRKDYRLTGTDEAFLRALKGTVRVLKD
jgi:DNA-binding transcriptional LysR family regulator